MATRPITLAEIRALAGASRQGPATVEERKMLAAANRHLKLAGQPSLSDLRARRMAAVSGQAATRMVPPGGVTQPVFLPEQTAFVVPGEPLDTRRLGAQRKLGLQPAGIMRGDAINPSALVPATYRPLAGLAPNKRGNQVIVDSTLFDAATASLPSGSPGFFARNTLVEVKSPGEDAELLTITVGVALTWPLVPGSYSGFDPRVYAEVEWGIGGAEYVAAVDVVNGTQLSIAANYLRVVGVVPDNRAASFIPPHTAPLFILTGSAAYGSPPANPSRARRTIEVAPAGDSDADVVIEIPRFATAFAVQAPAASLPVLCSQSEDGSGGLTAFVNVENVWTGAGNTANQTPATIPVANGARFLRVQSMDPGESLAQVSIVFDLAF